MNRDNHTTQAHIYHISVCVFSYVCLRFAGIESRLEASGSFSDREVELDYICNSAVQEQRQEDFEFQTSLSYRMSLSTVWALCETMSQNKTKLKVKEKERQEKEQLADGPGPYFIFLQGVERVVG